MSVKHLKEYYEQVCDQYIEMKNEIKDLEEEVNKGLAKPEMMDNLKATIQPIMNNYQTLSCVMYLLNQPNKKSKLKAYERRNHKFVQEMEKKFGKKAVLDTNAQVIDKIKKLKL